ncbi:MAG: PAS domain S-box protein [Candidatus Omnitrophica bacterium]|nr:PAS domain S-box protein [Candidatus Omnitrophota bacterium]
MSVEKTAKTQMSWKQRMVSMWLAPVAILVISLTFTLLIWKATEYVIYMKEWNRFEMGVMEIKHLIEDRVHLLDDALPGLNGLFAASIAVDRNEWDAYLAKVMVHREYPGIKAYRFIERVKAQDLSSFIEGVKNDRSVLASGYPDFEIFPEGKRDEYFVVKYIVPYAGNEHLMGFDLGGDSLRRKVLETARDTGRIVTSGQLFIPDKHHQAGKSGFLMAMPVYRNGAPVKTVSERREALTGFVDILIEDEQLFVNISSNMGEDFIEKRVALKILDEGELGTRTEDNTLLYASDQGVYFGDSSYHPVFLKEVHLNIPGRSWKLIVITQPMFFTDVDDNLDKYLRGGVIFGGMGLSIAIFFISLLLGTARSRAVSLAEKMTAELRESKLFLKSTLDSLSAHIAILDNKGTIVAVNKAWRQFADENHFTLPDYGVGTNYFDVCDKTGKNKSEKISEVVKGIRMVLMHHNYVFTQEYTCHSPGQKRWFVMHVTRFEQGGVHDGGYITVAHEDITQQKLAEETKIRLANIVESSDDAIYAMGLDGVVVSWNKGAEQMYGYTAEEMIGSSITKLQPPDRQSEIPQLMERIKKAKSIKHHETVRIRKDGKPIFEILVLSPLLNESGEIVGASGIARDVTERHNMEEVIKENQARLKLFLDSAVEAIFGLDLNGDIVSVNPACLRLLKYQDPVELLGKNSHKLFHYSHSDGSSYPQGECGIYRAFVEGKATHSDEDFFWRSDGTCFPIEYWSYPIFHSGKIAGCVVSFFDITVRKRAQKRISIEYQITKVLAESDALKEASPKILKMLTECFGWKAGAIWLISTKANVLEFIDGWYEPSFRGAEFKAVSRSRTFEKGIGLPGRVWASGQPAWIEDVTRDKNFPRALPAAKAGLRGAFGFPIYSGNEILGVMEFFNDRIEEPDEEFTIIMSSIAGQMGQFVIREKYKNELCEARDVALEASRAKSDFLATMSHEIRTPMNAIIGMAELLDETSLSTEQKEFVRIFRRAGDTLLNLINDILDLSKVESGNLELEDIEFDLNETIEKIMEIMAIRAHQKGLELSYHIMPDVMTYLMGDPNRLRQILTNLIGNAIKFTEKGEIVVEVKRLNGESVFEGSSIGKYGLLFSVKDTGIGVGGNKLSSIFEPFVQADSSTTRKYGGSGLGLAITKRLVELMGGKIWVESKESEGSVFYFTIQLGTLKEAQIRPFSQSQHNFTGLRVLIIDDNATNRLILRETLTAYGMSVVDVASADKGIEELKNARVSGKPYQLLLLDCRMPGKDGFQAAEEIKKDSNIEGVIIMMLTSEGRYGDIARARKLGLSGYVVKPIKRQDLLNTISLVLSHGEIKEKEASVQKQVLPHGVLWKILLVEDSLDNQLLMKAYFKNLPYQLDIVENGEEAVNKFKNNSYDLVLMDVQMPVMDGLTATQLIRGWERENKTKLTPIVALTAHAFKEDVQRCLDAGCDECLTKPVKKAKLFDMITAITSKINKAAA